MPTVADMNGSVDPPSPLLPGGVLRGHVLRRGDDYLNNDVPFPFVGRRADVLLHLSPPGRALLAGEVVSVDWAAGEVVVVAHPVPPRSTPPTPAPATHPATIPRAWADPSSHWEMLLRHNDKVWELLEMGRLDTTPAPSPAPASAADQPELPSQAITLPAAKDMLSRGDPASAVDTLTYCLAELSTALTPVVLYKIDSTLKQIATAAAAGAAPPPPAVTTELNKLLQDRVEMAELHLLRAIALLGLRRPGAALADCAVARACGYHPRFVAATESTALRREMLRSIPRVTLVEGKAKEVMGEVEEAFVAFGATVNADRVDVDVREEALVGQGRVAQRRGTYQSLVMTVELEGLDGLRVWRKLVVPACLSLGAFSAVIIGAMGWCNHPNHQFVIDGCYYVPPESEILQDITVEAVYEDEEDYLLSDQVGYAGARFQFLYDFDDMWVHTITVDDVVLSERDVAEGKAVPHILDAGPVLAGLQPPCVVQGAGSCPPETVGGAQGYKEFVDFVSGRRSSHTLYESVGEALDWAAGHISPVSAALPGELHFDDKGDPKETWSTEGFDLEAVNKALQNLQRVMVALSLGVPASAPPAVTA